VTERQRPPAPVGDGCSSSATVRLDCYYPEGRGRGRIVYVFHTCYACADVAVATYAPHLHVYASVPDAPRRCGDVLSYASGT